MDGGRRRYREGLRGWLPGLAGLLLLGLAEGAAAQGCAMCGTVGQGSRDPLVKGMFLSILFMVSMPFAVTAAVGGWIWYRLRARGRESSPRDDA